MTFKTEITEYGSLEDNIYNTHKTPLSYRLRLEIHDSVLVLKKEYFKRGFNDNEQWDKWWIYSGNFNLVWVSIITRKFEDTKYMKELETKIFEIFYDESVKITDEIKKDILTYTNRMNNKLVYQKEITKFTDKFNRRIKLENINKIK